MRWKNFGLQVANDENCDTSAETPSRRQRSRPKNTKPYSEKTILQFTKFSVHCVPHLHYAAAYSMAPSGSVNLRHKLRAEFLLQTKAGVRVPSM